MLTMLFQKKCLTSCSFLFICITILLASCNLKGYSSPPNYQMGYPEMYELSKHLNEVSGIHFDSATGNLLAISDSKKDVFELDLRTISIRRHVEDVVGPDSDLEDVVKVGSSIFVLKSVGTLVEVPAKGDTAGIREYSLNLGGKNDFETLYYDADANGLILLCKSCAHEKGKSVRTAYRFDLATKTFDSSYFYQISEEALMETLETTVAELKPSAAAIHPITKQLYILSSASQIMVIADTRGNLLAAYHLYPDDFPQAEGISFALNGDMYITNEGKLGVPTLYRFPYHPSDKKN